MAGDVVFAPPPTWARVDLPPPALREGSDLAVDRWDAWGAPDDGPGRAVSGCVGVDLGTWTDEATPFALDRLTATVGAIAARLDAGAELHLARTERTEAVVAQTFAGVTDTQGPPVARTFLGFTGPSDHPHLRGCFALCAPATPACEQALATATTSEFVAPPPATAPLRAVVFGVHHPRAVALSGVTLFLLLGVVGVLTRPRSRRK
jgi:hypothetical protein